MFSVLCNAWTWYAVFKMKHYTTVLHSSDSIRTLSSRYMRVCACVSMCVCSARVLHQSKPKSSDSNWWVARVLPLSPSFLDPVELLDIASSHPCREFDSGSSTGCQVCFFQGREEAMIYFISADTGSLSLLWTWSTNPSMRCCYVVVVVVRLPWRWAVSRSEPRIRLRRV